jgi:Asp/Glu/hydantoin racemase
MARRAAIVHAVPSLVPVFNELTSELLPDVHVLHLADEGLLKELRSAGRLTDELGGRLAMLAGYAEEYGAKVVMFNCSSLSPLVDSVKKRVNVPVFPVDEAMADRVVERGERIGVLATLQNTLGPTSDLIRKRAALKGRKVEVEAVLCEGAFDALGRGDTESHDRIVREYLTGLSERADVVALAQASMARVADLLPEAERQAPILTSPRPGVERLREMLDSLST